MEKSFKKKTIQTILLYNVLFLMAASILYFGIPALLNYPPYSINTEFEKHIDMGLNYYVQYIFAVLFVLIISNLVFTLEIRKIRNWSLYINNLEKHEKEIEKIKKHCFKIPINLYIIHAIVPAFATVVVLIFSGAKSILTIKITICLLAFFITLGLLIYVFSKQLFNSVLINLKNQNIYTYKYNFDTYRTRIFFQFLPLVLLLGTYAYLVVNSVAMEEKGEILFDLYKSQISQQQFYDNMSIEEAIQKLNNISKESEEDTYFIISNDKVFYQDTNEEISDFFIKYILLLDNNNRTYGYYATGIQGIYEKVLIDGQEYVIGIMYETVFATGYLYIWGVILGMLLIIVIFLIFFSKDFTNPILQISEYMKRISSGESVDYDKKIPVTSNDELGELTESFNKILDLEKKHVETIKENQDILVENGRLSSLGQLVGGIAHNLKTPIMSISGNLQGVQDLITEYDSSIGDNEVTLEDHKAIVKDMQELVDKTRVHLSYMSDVITAIKGQAVQFDSSDDQIFGVLEVVSRIEILMRHELKSALIEMDVDIEEDAKTAYIKGDVNSLVQVLNNLIQNSIYAYEGKEHKVIDFKITKEDNKIYFKIQDYGCGIPDNVKEKLFKEMITTKGKNGTGLGLYMSYSTIKGKFNGGFEFESEVGKGTTFIISIPVSK